MDVVELPAMKRGLVLCHGHLHRTIKSYFLNLAEWHFFDIRKHNVPDMTGNIKTYKDLQKARELINGDLFDYVLVYHCPLGGMEEDYISLSTKVMINARSILNNTGSFIYHGYVSFAISFLTQTRKSAQKLLCHAQGESCPVLFDEKYPTSGDREEINKWDENQRRKFVEDEKLDTDKQNSILTAVYSTANVLMYSSGYTSYSKLSSLTEHRIPAYDELYTIVFNA